MDSLAIFHNCFNDEKQTHYKEYSHAEIAAAIRDVTQMETHNSVKKQSLINALKWIYDLNPYSWEDKT